MRFVTDTISIYGFKLVNDGATPKTRDDQPIYTSVACCIQPAGDDIFTLFPGDAQAANAFVVYIYDTSLTIKNGFKLVDQNNNEYIVRGVPEVWTSANRLTNHIKVAAERQVKY